MKRFRLLPIAASVLFSSFAHAAAFQFYELGAPILGTTGVGQAAVTSDASIAYYNPAGMTQLQGSQFLLGTQMALPYTNFSPNSSNTMTGNNGGNAGNLLPGVDGYFVYNYSSKLKFGASLTSPYGGAANYDNHWVGRYDVQQMLLLTLNFNPAIAYQINDWVSVGGGFAIEYANLYQTVAIPLNAQVDGQATVKVDNVSPGFNLGVMFTPQETTKIGIAYRSQIIHQLRGSISFVNIPQTPSASTKLVMPANIIASISQDLNKQFTLLGELGWSNWSSMTSSILTVRNVSAVTPENWHDTYRIGLGMQYKATPNLLWQAGASYDSSPTSASKRLPELPVDTQIRLGTGIQYALAKSTTLGLSYEYLNLGRANINNQSSMGNLSGSYWRNYANFVQASLNVVF